MFMTNDEKPSTLDWKFPTEKEQFLIHVPLLYSVGGVSGSTPTTETPLYIFYIHLRYLCISI